MSQTIKNVFVSHHHKDDASVDGLSSMLSNKDYQLRNSSIRVKPENQTRLDQKQVSDLTIKRLLKAKMRWASQIIVVIGKETYSRDWVNWEIEAAHRLGKPIIGVYENGLKDKVKIPENLEKYATSIVGWRAESVISSLNGASQFEEPDGSASSKIHGGSFTC